VFNPYATPSAGKVEIGKTLCRKETPSHRKGENRQLPPQERWK